MTKTTEFLKKKEQEWRQKKAEKIKEATGNFLIKKKKKFLIHLGSFKQIIMIRKLITKPQLSDY